jgi:hypothetical protein
MVHANAKVQGGTMTDYCIKASETRSRDIWITDAKSEQEAKTKAEIIFQEDYFNPEKDTISYNFHRYLTRPTKKRDSDE